MAKKKTARGKRQLLIRSEVPFWVDPDQIGWSQPTHSPPWSPPLARAPLLLLLLLPQPPSPPCRRLVTGVMVSWNDSESSEDSMQVLDSNVSTLSPLVS